MASTWGDSWGGSTGAWLASWDRAATIIHKADVVVSDRAATLLSIMDSLTNTLAASDSAVTLLTVRDYTRNE